MGPEHEAVDAPNGYFGGTAFPSGHPRPDPLRANGQVAGAKCAAVTAASMAKVSSVPFPNLHHPDEVEWEEDDAAQPRHVPVPDCSVLQQEVCEEEV